MSKDCAADTLPLLLLEWYLVVGAVEASVSSFPADVALSRSWWHAPGGEWKACEFRYFLVGAKGREPSAALVSVAAQAGWHVCLHGKHNNPRA